MSNITPMMKQYLEIKNEHKDAILFFRLGDFYEMFFEDAIIASKILEIALTGKNYGAEERAPMCGVPFHSADVYIQKLISAGKSVAICEQTEDPKLTKGIVKREVIRIITPGTNVEDTNLEGYKDSYLMGIHFDENFYISYMDISTGEVNVATLIDDSAIDFIAQIQPKEILITTETYAKISHRSEISKGLELIKGFSAITILEKPIVYDIESELDDRLEIKKLNPTSIRSLNLILGYIKQTQGAIANNISSIRVFKKNDYLKIDPSSRKNLELIENATTRQKKNSLFDFLDYSTTSIGKRTLRKWIDHPLNDKGKINFRLDIIEELNQSFTLRNDLREWLNKIYDMERITGKLSYGTITSRDLVALRTSCEALPQIRALLYSSDFKMIRKIVEDMDPLTDVFNYLTETIVEEPTASIKDGYIIRSEYSDELREYRFLESNSSAILQEIEQREKNRTGIKGLKIGYNKVFGYYFEITHAAARDAEIPPEYIRKQTLSNAERYINQELKELEDKILGARQRIFDIQSEIFEEVKEMLRKNILRINKTAELIGQIDALLSLSFVSIQKNMVRPSFNNSGEFHIQASRHPVIEEILGEENFVPNDIVIDNNSRIQIITGPNMGGKSTFMRQTAIIAIMAHIGSFVPAKFANLPLLDAIFTRVGASDDLSLGQSTFMVEMKEVSYILNNATQNSLIILDEVGRGTSTYDGMSIAWAIIEYLAEHIGSTTLFSTHYHEITALENSYDNIKNFHIAVDDNGDNVRFMHKIMPGKMDKSYGIHVAKIAGLPNDLIRNANKKLFLLENEKSTIDEKPIEEKREDALQKQLSLEDYKNNIIIEKLRCLDMDDLSPRQAFQILDELRKMSEGGEVS